MLSAYLGSSDFNAYGIADTALARVTQASAMIDMHLKRPEGLVWVGDAVGNPLYMAAARPTFVFSLVAAIVPGQNVPSLMTGPTAQLQPGDVLILDRAAPGTAEAVVVNSVAGSTVTLRNVIYAHPATAQAESGLVITEQRSMPDGRPITMLSRTPAIRILSGAGRYGYGRRGAGRYSNQDDSNLLATLSAFGGPPAWEIFDEQASGVDAATGQLWVPAGVLLSYYSEVKIRYVAGFSQATLPSQIKQACALLIRSIADAPDMASLKSYRAGDTAIQRFSDTQIPSDVKDLLRPYQVRSFY